MIEGEVNSFLLHDELQELGMEPSRETVYSFFAMEAYVGFCIQYLSPHVDFT